MAQLSFGLVGCGGMGKGLAEALCKVPEARLVAVCDPAEAARQEAAQTHSAEAYADYRELLARDDIGAVIVATPTLSHRAVTVAAAAAGKHVFCEKPMELTLAASDEMIAAAKQAGVKFMVGQVLRLMYPWARIKELTADFGPALCVDTTRIMPWNARGWRQMRATSGGPLFEVNVHELDFMRHMCGEVAQISAYGGNLVRHDLDFPDIWFANLRFRSGAVANLRGGVSPRSYYGGEVTFEQNVSVTFEWGKLTVYRPGEDPQVLDAKEWTRPSGLQWELGSFTRWVLCDEAPVLTAADGRAAIEMAVAVDRSLEEGRPVDLPL